MENNIQNQISAEDAKANLGLVTYMMGLLMPKNQQQPQNPQQTQKTPIQTQEKPQPQQTPTPQENGDLEGKFSKLEKDLKQTIESEMGQIRETIQSALDEETKDDKDAKEQT